MSKKWKNKSFGDGFNRAVEGIFESMRTERHMKFHGFITVIIFIFALFYNVNKYEAMALTISVALVWIAELINTSIEDSVDLTCEEYNDLARKAKDISAGAVLIASLNALAVGYFIFEDVIRKKLSISFLALKNSYQHMAVFAIFFTSVLVICVKMYVRRGTPLRGGFPSGHSAVSGCIFVLINYLANDSKIFFLSLLLTILVLQSRIEGKIHSLSETVVGVIFGIAITYLILYFFG